MSTTGRRVTGRDDLTRILEDSTTIAVIGASREPTKAAHTIPAYLADQGYRVLPVNPYARELFGEPVHRFLREIDVPLDVVDVFRPPAEAEDVARQAAASGAKVLWYQPGTHTEDAVAIALDARMIVVTGYCIGATHAELGIPPLASDRPTDADRR